MTFQYLLGTKTPHKEVVIPFLDFPAFNKKQKDKDFIHPRAYKEQFTSWTKANNYSKFSSSSAWRFFAWLTKSPPWKQYWLGQVYTYTIILDASIMNSSKKMVYLS